jgi:hypothetical protein
VPSTTCARWPGSARGWGNRVAAGGVPSVDVMVRRSILALLAVAAAAGVAVLPAAGKEGVTATLTSSIPLDAPAGTRLTVAWTLSFLENGRRQPFGANGVFVRLRSASGAGANEAFAPTAAHSAGEYAATVVVPKGGIGDVVIGLMGWRSDASGTTRGDALFPIANDPMPGPARVVSSGSGSTTWILVLAAAVASALAVLAVASYLLRSRRRRSSAYSVAARSFE